MQVPDDLRYSSDHEWIRADGEVIRIGITDYAQDALGDIVFIDLPDVGTEVAAGQSFSEVESTKSVSDIYAPVAGRVTAVNDLLGEQPELVNSDPYGEGWLCELAPADPSSVETLMDAAAYVALTES